MSVSRLDPEKVLVGLAQSRWAEGRVFSNIPKYWCARCDVVTQFNLRVQEPPEFTFQIRKAMDAASGPARPYEIDYCDFVCRSCLQPVRVRYGQHEFAMSSYVHSPLDVFVYEPELLK
jgi:hypothetical protein